MPRLTTKMKVTDTSKVAERITSHAKDDPSALAFVYALFDLFGRGDLLTAPIGQDALALFVRNSPADRQRFVDLIKELKAKEIKKGK